MSPTEGDTGGNRYACNADEQGALLKEQKLDQGRQAIYKEIA